MGKLELVTPGHVVELVEGMQDLYIMGTVDGFQKVTKIDGLQDMSALTVSKQSTAVVSGRLTPHVCVVAGRVAFGLILHEHEFEGMYCGCAQRGGQPAGHARWMDCENTSAWNKSRTAREII